MKILLAIGTGSLLGGLLRYWASQTIQARYLSSFPFGTFAVNILGCFLIGIVYALSDRFSTNETWRLFLTTGLLGGFTTFSAFSYETVNLLQQGQAMNAFAYVAASVSIGLLATYAGMVVIRIF